MMILESIVESHLLGPLLLKEDGIHLQYWMSSS
jgi:hypothetical protein